MCGPVHLYNAIIVTQDMSEKTECNSEENANQDDVEKKPARKQSSKREAVPIPMGGAKPSVQNANKYNAVAKKQSSNWEAVPIPIGASKANAQRSYLDNSMDTASHAMKDQKENWQRIQRTTFTNWINNRLQGI